MFGSIPFVLVQAGVTAVLIRKDNTPKWNPSKLEDVSEEEVLKFFKPDDDDELPM